MTVCDLYHVKSILTWQQEEEIIKMVFKTITMSLGAITTAENIVVVLTVTKTLAMRRRVNSCRG